MEENTENKRPKSEVNLRKLMQKLGLGTNDFAKACGVSSQSMAQYLRPDKSLTTTTLYKIATALDIDPRDMFFPTEEKEEEELFVTTSPQQETEEEEKKQNFNMQTETLTFCPHCGAKVRVGVVLLPE